MLEKREEGKCKLTHCGNPIINCANNLSKLRLMLNTPAVVVAVVDCVLIKSGGVCIAGNV